MKLIVPVNFPLSYGKFFLLPLIFLNNNLLKLFYPYIFISSVVGLLFSFYFIFYIKKYILFLNIYNDPLLTIYPKNNKNIYYRIHIFFIYIVLKFLFLYFWPVSYNIKSIFSSLTFFIFLYILNIVYYNFNY